MTRRFHNSSIFGPGRRVPLDREQRARFKARLRLQRRPGRVSAAAEDVALALLEMVGADGRLDPSHDYLARRSGASLATVKRVLPRLRELGFLDWDRRLVRSRGTGWRCEQTSNAYVLRVPACEAHFERAEFSRFKKKEQKGCSGEMTDAEARANADRQLRVLGFPVGEVDRLSGLPPPLVYWNRGPS